VRAVDRRHGEDLAPEALDDLGVADEALLEDLERGLAARRLLARAIDARERAFADLRQDLEIFRCPDQRSLLRPRRPSMPSAVSL
jgi:hypothetical protein